MLSRRANQTLVAATSLWRRRQEWLRLARILDRRAFFQFSRAVIPRLGDVIRAGNTSPLAHIMAGVRCKFDVDGRHVVLDGAHFAGARELYARQVYESLPGFAPGVGETIVDLGANVGVFAILAATAAARVIAVEAQATHLDALREAIRENDVCDRVSVVHALVGGNSGVFAQGLEIDDPRGCEFPRTLTMQALLEEQGVEVVHLLKCDIEGSEFDLFTSSEDWIGRVRRIVMEVHPEFGDADELARRLDAAGFEVNRLDDDSRPVRHFAAAPGYIYARRR